MFNPTSYDNSRPGGIGVLEIVNGAQEAEKPRRFVPLKRTLLRGEVFGPLASLRLIQTYGYTKDAGLLDLSREVISIAGSGEGADTAIVLKPAYSRKFMDLEIREILAKPRMA